MGEGSTIGFREKVGESARIDQDTFQMLILLSFNVSFSLSKTYVLFISSLLLYDTVVFINLVPSNYLIKFPNDPYHVETIVQFLFP
jgi:hypothetical protein